jgi:hypothetical protein
MWVRIAAGRLVVDELDVPRHDLFSFTAFGEPWLDHEWLLGVVTYGLYSVSYELVVLFFVGLALAPFALMHVYAVRRGSSGVAMSGLVAVALLACWRNFTTRPTVVNPLFFAVLLIIIDRRRRDQARGNDTLASLKDWRLPGIVLLMLFWANLHAGFLIGLAAIAAWVVASLFESRDRTASVLVLAASSLVVFLNAYGVGLVEYVVWAVAGDNPDREWVQEWMSPDFHNPLNWTLIPAMAVAVYFGVRQTDRFRILILIGTLVGVFFAGRYQPFFSVALLFSLAPLIAAGTATFRLSRALRLGLVGVVTLAMSLYIGTIGREVTKEEPVQGLAYVEANCPDERVLSSLEFSTWLVWERFPVFIDGRTNQVYPDGLLRDYFRFDQLENGWEDVPDRYGINTIMFQKEHDVVAALQDMGWREVFAGDVETILVRPAGQTGALGCPITSSP